MTAVPTVAAPPDLVDVSAFDSLAASLSTVPLAGRDDVEAALGQLPGPREVLPYERWASNRVTVPLRRWGRPDVTWQGLGVADGLAFYLRSTVGGMRVVARDHSGQYGREASSGPPVLDRPAATDEELAYAEDIARSALADVESAAANGTRGVITEWSRRSRARMVEVLSSLDYSPTDRAGCQLGMVTLTYPGRWLDCAPTGKVAKKHLGAFKRAWLRGYGWAVAGAWKLEFQRRGAPHFHLLLPCPTWSPGGWHSPDCARGCEVLHSFTEWLSWTWAAIVGADVESGEFRRHVLAGTGVDFGARTTDPRRIGVYFLKHGTKSLDDKEYQHVVPLAWRSPDAGPGRFWGVWGLSRTDVVVPVDVRQYVAARRLLRRVGRARARSAAYRRAMRSAERQGLSGAASVRYAASASWRAPRTLGSAGGLSGGWLLVNDGVRLAQQVAYWLALTEGHSTGTSDRAPAAERGCTDRGDG